MDSSWILGRVVNFPHYPQSHEGREMICGKCGNFEKISTNFEQSFPEFPTFTTGNSNLFPASCIPSFFHSHIPVFLQSHILLQFFIPAFLILAFCDISHSCIFEFLHSHNSKFPHSLSFRISSFLHSRVPSFPYLRYSVLPKNPYSLIPHARIPEFPYSRIPTYNFCTSKFPH